MKKIFVYLFFVILCTNLFAQSNSSVNDEGYELILNTLLAHSVPEVNVQELKSELNEAVLLDAREEEEFEVSHIKGAKFVGFNYFSTDSIKNISKETPVVIYCSVGYRSEKISEKLIELGYKNVSNLYGGIFEWVNQGNEVVTGKDNKPTEEVHAYDKVWGSWLKEGKKVY